MPPTQTPTQKLKSGFSMLSSQRTGLSLISFELIFEALQSEAIQPSFIHLVSKPQNSQN